MVLKYKCTWYCDLQEVTSEGLVFGETSKDCFQHVINEFDEENIASIELIWIQEINSACVDKDDIMLWFKTE